MASGTITDSMAVATLMSHGGKPLEEVLATAKAKLRCVNFSSMDVSDFDLDSVGGRRLRFGGGRSHGKYAKSTHCEPRDVDLFVSHSWQDPSLEKWSALKSYCDKWTETHNREPRVWLDMYCLDPDSISEPQFHPVYLMASNHLVVLKGPTFLTQLWCCIELLMYVVACCVSRSMMRVTATNCGHHQVR